MLLLIEPVNVFVYMGIGLLSALAALSDEIFAEVLVHNNDRSSVRVVVIPADLVSTHGIFHDDVIAVTGHFHVADDLGV